MIRGYTMFGRMSNDMRCVSEMDSMSLKEVLLSDLIHIRK
jgi:hypothetical protein